MAYGTPVPRDYDNPRYSLRLNKEDGEGASIFAADIVGVAQSPEEGQPVAVAEADQAFQELVDLLASSGWSVNFPQREYVTTQQVTLTPPAE